MATLPHLPQYLAGNLVPEINTVAEPYRQRLIALLRIQTCSELGDLQHDLAIWFAGMQVALMLTQYQLVRQMVRRAAEIFGEVEAA